MTQREEFEAWFVKAYHPASLQPMEHGCYLNLGAGMAWDAWQAAQAAQAAQPGYTIYKTNLGRSGPFSLYDGEALALWTNIGKALGPEYTGTSPAQPSQCLQSVADALTIEQLNDKVERLMAVQPAQNHIEQYLEMVSTQPARVPWWLPIESAPKDGTRVLIKADCTVVAGWQNVFDDTFGWVVINDVWVPEHIATHWQPLPAAPSTKEQRNA